MTRSSLEQNLVGQVMACPADERFEALKDFLLFTLTMVTQMRRKMIGLCPPPPELALRYSCTEELVLFNATAKPTFIADCQFPEMQIGNCFGNAFQLSMEHPELRYVEGWACMEQSIPTHHAWVEHPDGSVSDPTWLGMVKNALDPINGNANIHVAPDYKGRCVYLGVSIPLANHLAWFEENGTPNLLAFGDMMPVEVLSKGTDAWASAIHPDLIVETIRETCESIAETPQWLLNADRDGYERRWPDGRLDTWAGDDYVA